jgi:hypothetical protein
MQDQPHKTRKTQSLSPTQDEQSSALSGTIEGKATFDDLKRKAADDLGTAKDKAKDQLQAASDKVEEVASKQKNVAARYAASIGTALEKVGVEMQSGDDAQVGKYAKDLGATVKSYAKDIENRELGEVASMAEDYGRRQPLAFLGVAAIAGLAASRFLTASAHRRKTTSGGDKPTDARSKSGQLGSNADD